jgi:acyl transferase domain-containing protein
MMMYRTNIGHTEATSGLASVIKTVMALEKLQIPPSINFDQPNPNIPFSDLGIKVTPYNQQSLLSLLLRNRW